MSSIACPNCLRGKRLADDDGSEEQDNTGNTYEKIAAGTQALRQENHANGQRDDDYDADSEAHEFVQRGPSIAHLPLLHCY